MKQIGESIQFKYNTEWKLIQHQFPNLVHKAATKGVGLLWRGEDTAHAVKEAGVRSNEQKYLEVHIDAKDK